MKKNEPVTRVMTPDPVCVEHNERLSSARHLINEKSVHHLPVIEANKVVGMLTSNDLLRLSFDQLDPAGGQTLDEMLDGAFQLSDLMNSNPVTIDSTATVQEAARILAVSEFHSLPVTESGELVGIVTSSDLIAYLVDQY